MKILGPKGKVPDYWIFREPIACPECGARFQVEPGDDFANERAGTLGCVVVRCPVCRWQVRAWERRAEARAG